MNSVEAGASSTTARTATALIVIGAALRIWSFLVSDNAGGDAGARVALTANWLHHPYFKVDFGAYPAGHFWLIGLFSLLFHDIVTAGRVLSLVCGIGSLYLVWKLAALLFDDESGILSLAVFCFYSLHIGYSTTSSAEVSYMFFLLAGLYGFFLAIEGSAGPKIWLLAASGLALSVAESIRLEAWVFFFGLSVILLYVALTEARDGSRWGTAVQSLLIFGVSGGAWPAFIMFYSWRTFSDPMHTLSVHDTLVTEWMGAHPVSLAYQLALVPVALIISLSPLAFMAALFGMARSVTNRSRALFTSLVLFFCAIQIYEIATGKLLAMARYTLTLGTLLSILAGYGLWLLCSQVGARYQQRVRVGVLAYLVLNLCAVFLLGGSHVPYGEKLASVSPRLRFSPRITQVGQYLRRQMRPEDCVVIDDYNVESNVIAEAAGLPLLAGKRAYLLNVKNNIEVLDYIDQQHPRFVVYSDKGTLRRWLPLSVPYSAEQILNGVDYRCVLANDTYRIYELTYRS